MPIDARIPMSINQAQPYTAFQQGVQDRQQNRLGQMKMENLGLEQNKLRREAEGTKFDAAKVKVLREVAGQLLDYNETYKDDPDAQQKWETDKNGALSWMVSQRVITPEQAQEYQAATPEQVRAFALGDKEKEQVGAFAGKGLSNQVYNFLLRYNEKKRNNLPTTPTEDQQYALSYGHAAKPQRYTDPQGNLVETPGLDLSGFFQPPSTGKPQEVTQKEASIAQKEEATGTIASLDRTKALVQEAKMKIGSGTVGAGGMLMRVVEAISDTLKPGSMEMEATDMGNLIINIRADVAKAFAGREISKTDYDFLNQQIRGLGVLDSPEATRIALDRILTRIVSLKTAPEGVLGEGKGLKKGTVEDGYVFIGGDPSNPKSWKKQ